VATGRFVEAKAARVRNRAGMLLPMVEFSTPRLRLQERRALAALRALAADWPESLQVKSRAGGLVVFTGEVELETVPMPVHATVRPKLRAPAGALTLAMLGRSPQAALRVLFDGFSDRGWSASLNVPFVIVEALVDAGEQGRSPGSLAQLASGTFLARNNITRNAFTAFLAGLATSR